MALHDCIGAYVRDLILMKIHITYDLILYTISDLLYFMLKITVVEEQDTKETIGIRYRYSETSVSAYLYVSYIRILALLSH